ncbi:molybdenum cofactor synthesis 1 [Dermatophagoides pteronyssinus]|uniref:molybdenum cofactor synthesis 1 n=1 Tax=Dermatophagoides pteronyssinus TaxID=6956 RepID=UPI003F681869
MMMMIRFLTKESCSILYRTLSSSASSASLSNTKSALKTIIAATDTDNDNNHQPLMDTHGRRHDYLRISLTERCNLRCLYCMPEEGIQLQPKSNLMNNDEIYRMAKLFVERFGIRKIRFTGGEPLIRSDIIDIIENISELKSNGLEKISLTTNGILFGRYSSRLRQAGLDSVNISLDTLNPDQFQMITRRNGLAKVIKSIETALSEGYDSVKINFVPIQGLNDDEIEDFIELTKDSNLEIRFIEYMPFDGNHWRSDKMLSFEQLIKRIESKFNINRLPPKSINDTAILYQVEHYIGTIGFINSMTNPFCNGCNRIRLTADGNLKVCLFDSKELSLKNAIRNGMNDNEIDKIIRLAVQRKKKQHSGALKLANSSNRPMILIDQRKSISTSSSISGNFSHIDSNDGHQVKMVNVGEKFETKRIAQARSRIYIGQNVMKKIEQNQIGKGNVLTIAKIAGIMATKSTSNLIPLCHQCPLDYVDIKFQFNYQDEEIIIDSICQTNWKTGIEMEALIACTIAALTIYDMCKALNKSMIIRECYLLHKSGGKSGDYHHSSH